MNKEIDLVGTGSTDAKEWAGEFMRIFATRKDDIDEDLMITWFANAIEVAKDSVKQKLEPCLETAYQTCGSNGQYVREVENEQSVN